MSDPNTRKEKRTPVTLKIKFKSATLDQFIERYSVDVSHGGIFIRTKDPLAVGTQLRFEFQLQDSTPLISGEGTVVWTREHDPTRIGVAPGMGVRFDKLAPESQAVLDKILAQKTKDTTPAPFESPREEKEKTRVAPAPLVSGLAAKTATTAAPPAPSVTEPRKTLMGLAPPRSGFPEETSRDATPLPNPMPFHSGGDDDFSEDVFEQPTRVAALDLTLLRASEGDAAPSDDLGLDRREKEEPLAKAPAPRAEAVVDARPVAKPEAKAVETRPQVASEDTRRDEPKKPEPVATPQQAEPLAEPEPEERVDGRGEIRVEEKKGEPKRLVDEPKVEVKLDPELGPERSRPKQEPRSGRNDSARAPARGAEAPRVAARTEVVQAVPPPARKSSAPLYVMIAFLLVAGGAAFFVMSKKKGSDTELSVAAQASAQVEPSGEIGKQAPPTPAPDQPVVGMPQNANTAPEPAPGPTPAPTPAPPAPQLLDVSVASVPPGATVEVDGVLQPIVTPGALKGLEADKTYKVTVKLACYADHELAVVPSARRAHEIALKPLPKVLRVVSSPPGALVLIDGKARGASPVNVPLPIGPASKSHAVVAKKVGYVPSESVVPVDSPCVEEGGKGVIEVALALSREARAPSRQAPERPVAMPERLNKPVLAPKAAASTPKPAVAPRPKVPETPVAATPTPSAPAVDPAAAPPKKPVSPPAAPPATPPSKPAAGASEDEHVPDWMKNP
ncbi:MAG: TIGR02266 family protein [Deltaproteobacteria bacterium]|nr:TIGR02266 family protein [Deltaproteobacteria bacterium]